MVNMIRFLHSIGGLLLQAVLRNDLAFVKVLLARGGNPNLKVGNYGSVKDCAKTEEMRQFLGK
jgi:hypothetical protein